MPQTSPQIASHTDKPAPRSVVQTKPRALIYCRVSGKKQVTEGSGLDSQETRCRNYAADKGYHVEDVFPDDVSGGGDYMLRRGMVALLSYLDTHSQNHYVVIFDDLERLARDRDNHFRLRRALAERGATVECPNFTFEDTPEGEFIETIIAAQGQLERQQNARQTLQKMKARIQAGYYCRNKVVGYRYQKAPGGGKILVPDEPNAALIREAFEGYASERFESVADVARFLKSHPSISSSMTRQRATDILRQPLYAGYISIPSWGFQMHQGKHEPLISLHLWQAAQTKLEGKRKRPARCDVHEDFPLRNFVACEGCDGAMTAAWSKGRTKHYGYYTCQTKGCDWYGKSIRKEKIETAFGELVRTMTPAPGLLNAAKAMFSDLWNHQLGRVEDNRQELGAQLAGLDQQMSKLMKRLVKAECDAVVSAYESEIASIEHEKRLLQERATSALEPRRSFEECFKAAMDFLSNPWILWESGSFAHKRLLLKLAIPAKITYAREKGFSNPELSMPLKLLGGKNMQELQMVPRRRLELPRP